LSKEVGSVFRFGVKIAGEDFR